MSGVYSWRLLQQRDWVRHLEFVVLFFVDNINIIIIHRVLYVWEVKGIIIICIHSPIYSWRLNTARRWTDPSLSLSPDGFIQWHVLYAVYCINKHGGNDGQSINVNCQCLLLLLLRSPLTLIHSSSLSVTDKQCRQSHVSCLVFSWDGPIWRDWQETFVIRE